MVPLKCTNLLVYQYSIITLSNKTNQKTFKHSLSLIYVIKSLSKCYPSNTKFTNLSLTIFQFKVKNDYMTNFNLSCNQKHF